VGDGARALGELGDDLVNRPRVIPGKAHSWFRRWFAKIWKVRGGGLYACGYAATFLVLEVRSLTGDVFESDGVVDFVTSQVFEFVFRFLSESFINMLLAFLWPLYVIQFRPPWGIIGLGLAFAVFDRFVRARVERWLSADTGESPPGAD
jgi:hypothetical protein